MGKLILVFVFFFSFYSLAISEQIIEIKTSGGAERQHIGADGKPIGETFIGYNDYQFKQNNFFGDITLECSGEGWEQCKIDSNSATLKCDYDTLFVRANLAIKNGQLKGTLTDKITENKKSYKRTISWNSTGYLEDTEITIKLEVVK
ncbi:MAG: hypothetical protein WCR42_08905 [bacterium]